jgi:hypothetical protein
LSRFLKSGRVRCRAVNILSLRPHSAAGDVIVAGSIALNGIMDGEMVHMQMVYRAVYRRRDGRSRLTAWQATRQRS